MAMREWEFATAERIVFGVGTAARLGELAAPLGRKALVVTGRDPQRFAGVLGGRYPAPHGAVCARLLPGVMEANVAFARARAGFDPWAAEVLERYEEVAQLLTGHASASIEEGCEWVCTLVDELGVRPLSAFGLRREEVPAVVEESMRPSSMKGNPFLLPVEVLTGVLEQAL